MSGRYSCSGYAKRFVPKGSVCSFCVMDHSDADIRFDPSGRCSQCVQAEAKRPAWMATDAARSPGFEATVARLRKARGSRPFDAMIGVSGGLDSGYALVCAAEAGLKVLAMHCDTGWNTRQSITNIENLCSRLGVPLETTVIDWDAMRDAQRAFFLSGVPNCDIPQDHAIAATVNKAAAKFGLRSFVSGGNWVSESILPIAWGHDAQDYVHLSAIWRKFGDWQRARRFPTQSLFVRRIWQPYVRGVTAWRILNDIRYDPAAAERRLQADFGWQSYGAKHCESMFTRIFQSVYLPMRFDIDKRRAHLASLVVSGLVTRQRALEELAVPPMTENQAERDAAYLCEKLRFTPEDWARITSTPPKAHHDYPVDTLEPRLAALGKRWVEPHLKVRRNW